MYNSGESIEEEPNGAMPAWLRGEDHRIEQEAQHLYSLVRRERPPFEDLSEEVRTVWRSLVRFEWRIDRHLPKWYTTYSYEDASTTEFSFARMIKDATPHRGRGHEGLSHQGTVRWFEPTQVTTEEIPEARCGKTCMLCQQISETAAAEMDAFEKESQSVDPNLLRIDTAEHNDRIATLEAHVVSLNNRLAVMDARFAEVIGSFDQMTMASVETLAALKKELDNLPTPPPKAKAKKRPANKKRRK